MKYSKYKLSIRPMLPNQLINDEMTIEEKFQNETLRPILKIQHELILLLIEDFIKKRKNRFYKLDADNKRDYLKNDLLNDKIITQELKGLIIGLFTLEEIRYYIKNKSKINKRIKSLLLNKTSSFFNI